MARVSITVPDDVVARAKAVGLNVSRLTTAALVEELDRLNKIDALNASLAQLDAELGSISSAKESRSYSPARLKTETSPTNPTLCQKVPAES